MPGNYEVWGYHPARPEGQFFGRYTTPEAAAKQANVWNMQAKAQIPDEGWRYRVKPLISPEAMAAWRQREQARFADGTYTPVIWANESWYSGTGFAKLHFPHLSPKGDGLIAYTPDERHGVDDKQVPIKIGRYLNKFYGTVLSPETIAEWCAKAGVEEEDNVIRFAETESEIERVYRHGPGSCMSHPADHWAVGFHPVRIYAKGDLCAAYLERITEDTAGREHKSIAARAIAWREKKLYGRVYGDTYRFMALMARLGFQQGALTGARIRCVPFRHDPSYVVIPFIDNFMGARLLPGDEKWKDGYIQLAEKGPVRGLNTTKGLAIKQPICLCGTPLVNDEPEPFCDQAGRFSCGQHADMHCMRCAKLYWNGRYLYYNKDRSVRWCQNCMRYMPQCKHCGARMFDDARSEAPDVCETCFPAFVRTPGCGIWILKAGPGCKCDKCVPPEVKAAAERAVWEKANQYASFTTTAGSGTLRTIPWSDVVRRR